MKQELQDQFDSLEDLRRYYQALRSQGDIYPINPMTYVVTDYQLMRTIFRRPEDFRTFDFSDRIRKLLQIDPIKYDFEDIRESMSNWLLFMDGPEHLVWKKKLMQRLYGIDLQGIIKTEWEQVASSLDDRAEFDLMKHLFEPLISRIICSIIGIDPDQFDMLRRLEKEFMKALVPSMSLEDLKGIKQAHRSFQDIQIAGWEHGTIHQAKLLHELLSGVEISERHRVMSQMEFMLAAGIESSLMLLTESIFRMITDLRSVSNMLKQPDQRSLLIEELIRMSSPISVVSRKVMKELTLDGIHIREGSILLMFIACANRDPRYFPFPDEVSPVNLNIPHLAFGLGRHHCLGTELSKMEMNFILPAFMERFGNIASIKPETMKKSYYTPGIASARILLEGKVAL